MEGSILSSGVRFAGFSGHPVVAAITKPVIGTAGTYDLIIPITRGITLVGIGATVARTITTCCSALPLRQANAKHLT